MEEEVDEVDEVDARFIKVKALLILLKLSKCLILPNRSIFKNKTS
jgi:hypothetical protein